MPRIGRIPCANPTGKLIRALPLFRDVSDLFGSGAAFARAIVNELADRYRGVARSLKNEKLRAGAERLADCILQTDALQGNRQRVEMTFGKRTLCFARLPLVRRNPIAA